MDYSKLSDFEINKRVFNVVMSGRSWDKQGKGSFDYCNNPADAWPIILQNKIDLTFGEDVHEVLKGCCIASRRNLSYTHDYPLRAAMIVFLIMHDDK